MRSPKRVLQSRHDELTARIADGTRTEGERLVAGIRRDEVVTVAAFFGVVFSGQGRAFEMGGVRESEKDKGHESVRCVLAVRKSVSGGASLAGRFDEREEAERFERKENALAERFGLPWRVELREGGACGAA